MAHLQLKTGHLAKTSTAHLSLCAVCEPVDTSHYYLLLCDDLDYCCWISAYLLSAIDLGLLPLNGSTDIALPDSTCEDMTYRYSGTSGPTITTDVDLTNVTLTVVTSTPFASPTEVTWSIKADVDYTSETGPTSLTQFTIGSGTFSPVCSAGVYPGGTFGDFLYSVLDGAGNFSRGFRREDNGCTLGDGSGTAYCAPLSELDTCP